MCSSKFDSSISLVYIYGCEYCGCKEKDSRNRCVECGALFESRSVYYVDVGDMSPCDAKKYLDSIRRRFNSA